MLKTNSQKTVISGLFLALGIILPFATAHGFGLSGNIFLPMHLPVLLSGYICGPVWGGTLGFIMPLLNSIITGMPAIYPNALIMCFELLSYGAVSGILYKTLHLKKHLSRVYVSLVVSLCAGRIIYGLAANILLFFDENLAGFSVIAAIITGIPGIIAQLIIVPIIIGALKKSLGNTAVSTAKELIKSEKYSCVTVKKNQILYTHKSKGIGFILRLQKEGKLKDTFAADTIIGKAAAMIFTAGGVKACYGKTMSKSALEWLTAHGIRAEYTVVTESIINRAGTDICPMEKTVLNIDDPQLAIDALTEKIKILSSGE